MKWSRSEFLNLIELRSQCWCYVDLGQPGGFNIRHNDSIMFYAAINGDVKLSGVTTGTLELKQGDVVMILSGEAHTLRTTDQGSAEVLEFLCENEYVDVPPVFSFGNAPTPTRLLCSRLKVRWPSGQRPQELPSYLRINNEDCLVNLQALAKSAISSGASALLTRTAVMLFIAAFRDHPECKLLHRISNKNDPVLRACQYIELHPFNKWTIEMLATKVGMGRSNFAARFVAETGKTPMEYITAERMKHAANLLAQTDMKLASISEHIGYKSEAAFSRRFTEFYGISPGKMRKKIRQQGSAESDSATSNTNDSHTSDSQHSSGKTYSPGLTKVFHQVTKTAARA